MSKKNVGYLRVSTIEQNLENQKSQVLNFANNKKLGNVDFIQIQISSRKKDSDRKITELIDSLNPGDNLIVVELSRLGRSVVNVVTIINTLIDKGVNIFIIKEGLEINPIEQNPFTMFQISLIGAFAELEKNLISFRTKESLQVLKKKGVQLGRKKGTIIKSKYDQHKEKIQELHQLGLSSAKILKYLNIDGTQQSLSTFVKNKLVKNV